MVQFPPAFLRAAAWMVIPILAAVPLLSILLAAQSARPTLVTGGHVVAFLLGWGLIMLTGQAIFITKVWKLATRVKASEGRICLRCGYDLSAPAGARRCPECGRPFNPEADRVIWARFVDLQRY